ncbi:MAG TPA: hypothetical protein VFN37_05350 [Candidatus Baltobacteraceae bacterium]|nr:hypothetical protein [Candidatus Baltobacteraceae bacterium]
MRNSKIYAGFKTFNGVVFIVMGALIIFQIVRAIGFRFEAFSGLVLGAALIGLGVYRTREFVRSRR